MVHEGFQNKMKNMKKTILSVLVLFALLLVPAMVSATLDVSTTYSATVPTFGDKNQEASNPLHDDEDKEIIKATSSISIVNNEGETFNLVGITSFTDAKFGLTATDFVIITPITGDSVADLATIALNIEAVIPESLDAVDGNNDEIAFFVGNLNIDFIDDATGLVTVTSTIPVFMQRENKLEVKDFDALINNKDTENNIENGDDIKDLKPGDKVELTVTIKSNYNNNAEIDIEDVEIDITCDDDEDIDFDNDNEDVGDFGPKDDAEETLSFEIDDTASDASANCVLTVEGTDENGAVHGESIDFDISIDRDSHDIVIDDVRLSPNGLTCSDNSFQISVDLKNLGTRDEDQAAVQLQSLVLGLNEKISNLEMDEDDSVTETFVASVNPAELGAGKYAILVSSYYDNTKQTDSQVVQIENVCEDETTDMGADGSTTDFTNVVTAPEAPVVATAGKLASVQVSLTNTESSAMEFTVLLDNIEEFATSTASKTVFLAPGQTSNVFLNMKTLGDAEEGTYTANIVVKSTETGQTVETETFTVEVAGSDNAVLNFGADGSRVLLILANVALVILAIFLIKLIFSGSKKKRTVAKMADFEPRGSVVRKKK